MKKVLNYSDSELTNFKNGKVKIVMKSDDIVSIIKNMDQFSNNTKFYFGKISKRLSDKIMKEVGVNLQNFNISLKLDSVKHILKEHGSIKETLRGQVPIVYSDFKLIPRIIADYDEIFRGRNTKNNKPSLIFNKKIGKNYYLVNYVSDKNYNLEVQTMWKQKKNSATGDNT